MARLQKFYRDTVVSNLVKEFNYSSSMQAPKITKITLNMGVGEAAADKKIMAVALDTMTKIAGQKPIVRNARKSVAGFKIREGWPVGCKVTLRNQRMYEMLDRIITIALPRVRDFRGVSNKSFDGNGNYSFGFDTQSVFPEAVTDDVNQRNFGMDICITTTAKTDKEAESLLSAFNFPFKNRKHANQ